MAAMHFRREAGSTKAPCCAAHGPRTLALDVAQQRSYQHIRARQSNGRKARNPVPPATSAHMPAGANSCLSPCFKLLQGTCSVALRQWEAHAHFGQVWREALFSLQCAAGIHIQAILHAGPPSRGRIPEPEPRAEAAQSQRQSQSQSPCQSQSQSQPGASSPLLSWPCPVCSRQPPHHSLPSRRRTTRDSHEGPAKHRPAQPLNQTREGARLCTEGLHTLPHPGLPPKSGFSTAGASGCR